MPPLAFETETSSTEFLGADELLQKWCSAQDTAESVLSSIAMMETRVAA